MRTTPSTREFTSEPVPDEVVRHLLDVARFAPSGGNRQAWHVIVLQDPRDPPPDPRPLRRELARVHGPRARRPGRPSRRSTTAGGPVPPSTSSRRAPRPRPWRSPTTSTRCRCSCCSSSSSRDWRCSTTASTARASSAARPSIRSRTTCSSPRATPGSAACSRPFWRARSQRSRSCSASRTVTRSRRCWRSAIPAKVVTKLRRATVEEFTTVDRFDGRAFS